MADRTERDDRADWDYQDEPAYHAERAKLSKAARGKGGQPDFSAPSVASPGSQESGAEQAESDGLAFEGGTPTQKAAEIAIENKKAAQERGETRVTGGAARGARSTNSCAARCASFIGSRRNSAGMGRP
jgi:hypothetical protein